MSHDNRMNFDTQTLCDLEVFSDAHGNSGLFDSINSTCTDLGRDALKTRLKHPLIIKSEILAVQEALAFLRESTVAFPIEAELLTSVDRYLRSRIQVSAWCGISSKLNAIVSVAQNQDVLSELTRGVIASSEFLNCFLNYCELILSQCPGRMLEQLLKDAEAACGDMAAVGLCKSISGAPWSIAQRDTLFRLQFRDQLKRLVEVAAELDALNSMARFGTESGYVVPEVMNLDFGLEANGLIHPLVDNAIGNAVKLEVSANVIYLTGPNMAGKTTFLKAIGISQFLAQSGMLVPAKQFRFSPVEVLLTGINTTDNLSAGVSYYLAEVRRMKQAAEILANGKRSLMLFDEVFKGTNVIDATEATKLVIESCVGITNSMFVFSSHLSELVEALEQYGVSQWSFSGEIHGGEPQYSYQIKKGPSEQRMGLHLLKHEGVLDLFHEASIRVARDAAT